MRLAGALIAGGRSRRFGRDKAIAELRGVRLADLSLEVLRAGCDALVVAGPPALAASLGLEAVADALDLAGGPAAGIAAALGWARADGFTHLVTAPCDTPALPGDLVRRLARAADAPVVAAWAARPHPLCAIWDVGGLADLRRSLAASHPPLRALVEQLGGRWLQFPDEAAFLNLNTEADLAALAGA